MTNLKSLKISDLHQIAREQKVKYYKNYSKAELIELLEKLQHQLDAVAEVLADDIIDDAANVAETPDVARLETNVYDGLVVTTVLPNAPVHMAAFNAVAAIAEANNYELLIYPVKWGTTEVDTRELPSCIHPYLVRRNITFASTRMHGDLNINANAAQPLSQISGFAANKNVIVPHPVVYGQTTAAAHYADVKILMTTGTISDLEHAQVNSRVSATTKFHASLGATVITDSHYPVVNYSYDKTIRGIQVGNKVYGPGSTAEYEAIYLPDMHLAHPNPIYMHALLAEIKKLNPNYAIGGDLFDGSALCHHEKHKLGWAQNKISLAKELHLLQNFSHVIYNLTGQSLRMIIGNHETFADRFFSANLFQELAMYDKTDSVLILEAMTAAFKETKYTEAGVKYSSMISHWIKEMPITTVDCKLQIGNTNIGHHGDEYNTRKAGVRQAAVKVVIGHQHAPMIDRNLTVVGYGGHPEPTYQSGLTKAAPAHCLISPSGKRTLKIYQY
jgi:hypothetical protein